MRATKLQVLGSAAAIALLATMGSAAAVPTITVQDSGTPAGFTADNLGTSGAAGFQNSTTINSVSNDPSVLSIVFAGGSPAASGLYAGSNGTSATSPFPLGPAPSGSSLANYLAAQPGGTCVPSVPCGTVTITFKTPQTTLNMFWGTVDSNPGYNLLATNGGDSITGATILGLAAGSPGSGTTNTFVEITGLASFTTATFSDSATNPPAFEFDLAVPTSTPVPEPASLAIFGAALAAMGLIRRRRRQA